VKLRTIGLLVAAGAAGGAVVWWRRRTHVAPSARLGSDDGGVYTLAAGDPAFPELQQRAADLRRAFGAVG
jgi:hypothetical protein